MVQGVVIIGVQWGDEGKGKIVDYYAASADLRPRNLRRRVEVLVPVRETVHRRTIDRILDAYLTDATAWELGVDGEYVQRMRIGPSAQGTFSLATGDGRRATGDKSGTADRVTAPRPKREQL